MYREPDRFHCVGTAVSGGVHYTGGSRRVFAAAAVAALHAAHPVRHGSGHHAGGQCVWSLLLPAIQRGQTLPLPAWIPSAVGLVLGAVGLLQVEQFAGQLLAGGAGHGGRMVLAVTLHNLPEGMVAGLAAALALTGEPDAISGALALSLGIGLQNIPEGAAVSLPLAHTGRTRSQAFFAGAASGLVEPLGALLAFALAAWVSTALPWLLSAAAGCMVCVTAQEMIPQAVEGDEPVGVVSIVLGFALMMALDVAL